jgi:CheY-like chemotaxis protein
MMKSDRALRRVNVLAVDDIPANLIALEAVLARDYNLIIANSGREALLLLEKRQDIDVILMDLQMPIMDGYEAAARIKQIKGCDDIPIIFITAVYKEDPFVKKGYEAGAVDYFSKPFDPDILRMKVGIYASFRQRADVLKERERQIRETEELLRAGRKLSAIIETLPVGVLIADVDGRICQTNNEVSRICKSTDTIERDSYGAFLGWWDSSGKMIKDQFGPLARALQRGETSHNNIIHIQCFDGSSTTILGSASPLIGLDGQIVGAVVVIQDITETKKIEEDLEQRITKLISLGIELEQSVNN